MSRYSIALAVARLRQAAAVAATPYGYCHRCRRALTRIEAGDRSHRCPWYRLLLRRIGL